ncbi:MAG: N-acetylneuraminate synthase family protein [Chloroflexota bacterium]
MQIADRTVGGGAPTYIIAEIGSNHNGDIDLAFELIDACAEAGADAVKFQAFRADALVNPQLRPDFNKVLKNFELDRDWLPRLSERAKAAGVHFMATPFDFEAVELLKSVGAPAIKIASTDLTNLPLLRASAESGLPVIFSGGDAYPGEMETAVRWLREAGATGITALHCIADYPTAFEDVNLRVIPLLETLLGVPVGFSDHTLGLGAAVAAVALGAAVIEKHVTKSRQMEGPDHFFALEIDELAQMVRLIREAEQARGTAVRKLTPDEAEDRPRARRGIFARQPISAGTTITADMLAPLRPTTGIPAEHWDAVVGRVAARDIKPYEPLSWHMFEG